LGGRAPSTGGHPPSRATVACPSSTSRESLAELPYLLRGASRAMAEEGGSPHDGRGRRSLPSPSSSPSHVIGGGGTGDTMRLHGCGRAGGPHRCDGARRGRRRTCPEVGSVIEEELVNVALSTAAASILRSDSTSPSYPLCTASSRSTGSSDGRREARRSRCTNRRCTSLYPTTASKVLKSEKNSNPDDNRIISGNSRLFYFYCLFLKYFFMKQTFKKSISAGKKYFGPHR
jgi:hypothetical protein